MPNTLRIMLFAATHTTCKNDTGNGSQGDHEHTPFLFGLVYQRVVVERCMADDLTGRSDCSDAENSFLAAGRAHTVGYGRGCEEVRPQSSPNEDTKTGHRWWARPDSHYVYRLDFAKQIGSCAIDLRRKGEQCIGREKEREREREREGGLSGNGPPRPDASSLRMESTKGLPLRATHDTRRCAVSTPAAAAVSRMPHHRAWLRQCLPLRCMCMCWGDIDGTVHSYQALDEVCVRDLCPPQEDLLHRVGGRLHDAGVKCGL